MSVVFRTQSPTNRKDLLASQVRETMKAISGSRQNWKQEAELSSLARSIQRPGKIERMRPRHRDVWGPALGRTALAKRAHHDTAALKADAVWHCVLSHFVSPALGCPIQAIQACTYSQRKNKGLPHPIPRA